MPYMAEFRCRSKVGLGDKFQWLILVNKNECLRPQIHVIENVTAFKIQQNYQNLTKRIFFCRFFFIIMKRFVKQELFCHFLYAASIQ